MQEKAPKPKIMNRTTLSLVGNWISLRTLIGSVKTQISIRTLNPATTRQNYLLELSLHLEITWRGRTVEKRLYINAVPYLLSCQIPKLIYRKGLQDCDHLGLEEKHYYENNRAPGKSTKLVVGYSLIYVSNLIDLYRSESRYSLT